MTDQAKAATERDAAVSEAIEKSVATTKATCDAATKVAVAQAEAAARAETTQTLTVRAHCFSASARRRAPRQNDDERLRVWGRVVRLSARRSCDSDFHRLCWSAVRFHVSLIVSSPAGTTHSRHGAGGCCRSRHRSCRTGQGCQRVSGCRGSGQGSGAGCCQGRR